MSQERFELVREQFGSALERLHEALAESETRIVRDALIQRFEFTYELGWKCMFHWLRAQGERVPETVREVLKAGFRTELIGDAELWGKIQQYRNETSHTYNEKKAIEVAAFVRRQAVHGFDALLKKLGSL